VDTYDSPDTTSESSKAKKPKKTIFKRWWFWTIIVILIIALGSGCEEDKPKKAKKPIKAASSQGKDTVKPTPEAPEFFKVGETAETKKVKAMVTGIEKPVGNAFNKPADGNEFVMVNIDIENISDEDLVISSLFSFNAYVDDTATDFSLLAQTAKDGTKTMDGKIAPGKKLSGSISYEVPKTWKQLEVHFEPEAFRDVKIKWNIENK